MKFYSSKSYTSLYAHTPDSARNVFYILTEEERDRLADKIRQLEKDINAKLKEGYFTVAKTKSGSLKNTTKSIYEICAKDVEAVEFLRKLCWFDAFPESVALDCTKHQVETIINKLLFKVYRKNFIHWLEVYLDPTDVLPEDMRDHMNAKRKLFNEMQKDGRISDERVLGY